MHELFMMYMLVSINGTIRLSLCIKKKSISLNIIFMRVHKREKDKDIGINSQMKVYESRYNNFN